MHRNKKTHSLIQKDKGRDLGGNTEGTTTTAIKTRETTWTKHSKNRTKVKTDYKDLISPEIKLTIIY